MRIPFAIHRATLTNPKRKRGMGPCLGLHIGLAWALLVCLPQVPAHGVEPSAGQAEFFEKKIRPVLVEHCYRCHSAEATKLKGGLRLDSRAGLLQGGDNGPSLVPGNPAKSRLIEVVTYQNADLQMPPKGKLPDHVIADLTAWVKDGAPWPGMVEVKTPHPAEKSVNIEERKRAHWAWQPVRTGELPAIRDAAWPTAPSDRFLLAALEAKGLKPAPPTDPRTLLRRLSFDLIGLPPTAMEMEDFLKRHATQPRAAVADEVERLLKSPHFGERWGRHWLDLVRYAESRGHEFDPTIPNAYQYRDYVIRALNADVPYNQFVTEHVAGDLIAKPRKHPAEGFNESIIGTGFWFLGEEVHSPVDIRQDQADRFDNRIDVFTKTFLALTVSCARCHDHKFDAISTKDYYALFGVVESGSYRLARVDTLEQNRAIAGELAVLRDKSGSEVRKHLAAAAHKHGAELSKRWAVGAKPEQSPTVGQAKVVVDYATATLDQFLPDDAAFGPGPARVGELLFAKGKPRFAERAAAEYDRAFDVLKPAAGSENDHGTLGRQYRAGRTLRSPSFRIDGGKVWYLVRGAATAYAAVDGHTLIAGPLHGRLIQGIPASDDFRWVAHDLTPYQGHLAHIEFTPADNADFAVAAVVQAEQQPPAEPRPMVEFAAALERIETGKLTAGDARFANWLLAQKELQAAAELNESIAAYTTARERIAAGIKRESRLAPAMLDGNGVEENVFIRGSHKALGEKVPRRLLEALGTKSLAASRGSGRLELAQQLVDPKTNPFIARVFVNRVWHHLFGRGIVASTDNFGVLGEQPTHPELLDFLAERFVKEGWSLKRLIRDLVLSSAYAMSSRADPEAERIDPANALLHRMRLRRLEGEAIRDAMLTVSGRLDPKPFGPSVPIHLTPFLDGRGRPGSGPLDGNGRRSIYLAVRRNFLSPFLLTFDTPIPFSTVGRRQVSNVPAQALILLNDPFVHHQAGLWAKRVLAKDGAPFERITLMYVDAFGRLPTDNERLECQRFLETQAKAHRASINDPRPWSDLAHALFNVKEFIYLP